MKTRKVQLTGGSTYTISIPKQWANEHGIEAGRQLHLSQNGDGSMLISTVPPEENESTTACITVDKYTEDDLRRTVHGLYAIGLDEFTLTTAEEFSNTQRRSVTAAATSLIGLEVLEETDTRIVFQNLLDDGNKSIRQSVLQLEYVTIWMHRNAVTAVANADADQAKRVTERDDEADRLFGLVNRQFQRTLVSMQEVERMGFDRPTMFDYYMTARQLERVADHAEKIATIALRLDEPTAVDSIDELASAAHQSREIVVDAASVLLGSGSVDQAYTAFAERDQLLESLDSLDRALHNSSASDAYLLGVVLDSVRRTADYGGNIAERMIQSSLQPDENETKP